MFNIIIDFKKGREMDTTERCTLSVKWISITVYLHNGCMVYYFLIKL